MKPFSLLLALILTPGAAEAAATTITFDNLDSTVALDRLVLTGTYGTGSFNIDNIRLTAVLLPGALVLFLPTCGFLFAMGRARRKTIPI